MRQDLHVALLGPVTARRGGAGLAVGPPQQQAMLAALLLLRGRCAPAGVLVDATAALRRSTIASAVASETPAAA